MIKVCGMREPENIAEIASLPIDLMGAIFHPKSPRFCGDRDDSATAFRSLPETIKSVGVFVNADQSYLKSMKKKFNLDHLQLHGSETPEECYNAQIIAPIFKAFGLSEEFDFEQLSAYEPFVELFIFDTSCKEHGGSGKKFNWDILSNYTGSTPFLLSGGIGKDDADKINALSHPQLAGVDLNSGFELSPALKSQENLHHFITKLHHFS